jgi:archaellum component FlaF (FlaF/FlaG flagellin family)
VPWRSVNSNYITNNVASEQNDPSSLLNFYKKLINARNNEIALRRGTYKRITCTNNAIVSFIRQQEDQTIAIVVNLSNSDQTNVKLSLSGASISEGTKKVTDLLSNTEANDILIDNNKSFSDWSPLNTIKANSAYLFKIGALTNIKSSATEKVDVYPNPVMLGNNITIKLPQSFQHTQSVLRMTDLSGKILLQKNMSSNEFILDAANISSRGCYLLQIVNQNNRLSKLIIIK